MDDESGPAAILGIDLGGKRVGLAIAHRDTMVATGYGVIEYKGRERLIENLGRIVKEENIHLVVVGLPRNMDGSEGQAAKNSREVAELIRERLKVKVEMFDERLTTVQATRQMRALGGKAGRDKEKLDLMSATLILQGYLESLSQKN